MGERTLISWTNVLGYIGATWNPWQGCTKVSEGCENCYMYREKRQYGQDPLTVTRSKPQTFNLPLRVKEPHCFFTCSWSDWLHEKADVWRPEAYIIVERTPQNLYLVLTKRPERIERSLPEGWLYGGVPKNIWWGVTGENQKRMEDRYGILEKGLHFANPSVLFLSLEPLLGPINLDFAFQEIDLGDEENTWWIRAVDWVIVAGESGPGARPMHPDWVRSIRDQCLKAEVPFFFKGWGEWAPAEGTFRGDPQSMSKYPVHKWDDRTLSVRVGRKLSGCTLDGKVWAEYPLTGDKIP
jgi:protein gp37